MSVQTPNIRSQHDPATLRLVPGPQRRGQATRRRGPRWRRIAVLAAGLCLLPAIVSFGAMLTRPSNSSFGIRAVEWLRDNGAVGLVNDVENFYYSLNAPATGGPGLRALPSQAGTAELRAGSGLHRARLPGVAAASYRPPSIRPAIRPALPGEGHWRATFAGTRSDPPVLITSFRPDPNYPQMVAGVAWINHARTATFLYPGLQEPAVSLPSRGPEQVPQQLRPKLVATFNSGFKLSDSHGGFAIGGRAYAPLVNGLGTIVRYRNGTVDVTRWTAGPQAPANVLYARQNLPLIVDNGKPNPNLSDGPLWGATLGNAVRVWRSAVGVDSHGNLLYAAAPIQTVGSLAAIMIRAGAVRAMELDINTYWTSFISYSGPDAANPANLLPNMDRSAQRYLTPDDRDFFAVYLTSGSGRGR